MTSGYFQGGCRRCALSRRGFLAAAVGAAATPAFAAEPRPRGAPRAIDFHAHMSDPVLGQRPNLAAPPKGATLDRLLRPEAHLADMDRYGVAKQVVTMATNIQGITWGDVRSDLEVHRRVNDAIARDWVGKWPDRFIGSCTLPLQDIDLSLAELDRCVTTLGAKVVQISSCTPDNVYFGDPKLRPFWEMCERHKVTVFCHPHGNGAEPPLDQFALGNAIGQAIEEAKFMASVIYQGVFERYPDLKIVVAHGGGFLPHYYGRMDRNVANSPDSARNLKKLPSAYLKSFYYDSCVYGPDILTALIKIVGVDRLVLGGDYPVGVIDPLAELEECKTLSHADVEAISFRTASRLLGLPA